MSPISLNGNLAYSGTAAFATLPGCNASVCVHTLGTGETAALVIIGVIEFIVIFLRSPCGMLRRSRLPEKPATLAIVVKERSRGSSHLERWISEIGTHEFEVDIELPQI